MPNIGNGFIEMRRSSKCVTFSVLEINHSKMGFAIAGVAPFSVAVVPGAEVVVGLLPGCSAVVRCPEF